MKKLRTSHFVTVFFSLALLLIFAGCSSGSNPFGLSAAEGSFTVLDTDNDGIADTVNVDGTPIDIIPPTDSNPGCLDINGDGSCSTDEPDVTGTPDNPDFEPPDGSTDQDNDNIPDEIDLQDESGILLRITTDGVSSAAGNLRFDNGICSNGCLVVTQSDFPFDPPFFRCVFLNAKVGENSFLGLTINGSPGDELILDFFKGPDGGAMMSKCLAGDDPATATGASEACSASVVRGSGGPAEVDFSCDL